MFHVGIHRLRVGSSGLTLGLEMSNHIFLYFLIHVIYCVKLNFAITICIRHFITLTRMKSLNYRFIVFITKFIKSQINTIKINQVLMLSF